MLLACAGCTHDRLRADTVRVASTLTDLQYRMVLDNIAMMSVHPRILPWHVKLDGGSVQVNDQLKAEAGLLSLAWRSVYDAIEGRALILPERQATQQWDVVPVTNPRELRDLQALYRKALGKEVEPELLEAIDEIPTGWFGLGARGQAPADALYTGTYRDRWVWVTPDGVEGLSKLTLLVLQVAELKRDERGFRRGVISTPR